jgi:adenylate cyclase class 2|tara:strand:+ start:4269 stop:4805 length:537 start_codon:yes stop_codon:yes gene_type:complete
MQTEYELRILDIDVDSVISKLKSLGAKHIKRSKMKRLVYDLDIKPGVLKKWLRLRTDEEITTLTVKEITKQSIDGTKEIEIEVSDFEETRKLIASLGFKERFYQENKRCSWDLDGVKVEIDTWPLIPTYIEIEGNSKEDVEKTVLKLGFTMDQTTAIDVKKVHAKYGIDIHTIRKMTF